MHTRRARVVRIAPLIVVGALAFSLAACADDEGGSDDNGDSVSTPAVSRTPLPEDPLPTVEGNNVTSTGKGYAVTFPAGWEPRFNFLATPAQRIDVYFAPDDTPDVGVRANIALSCDRIASDVTIGEYFERKRALVVSLSGAEPPEAESITVGGVQAFRIEYDQPQAEGENLRKVDTYLVGGECGYNISLTVEQAEVPLFIDSYDAFVASFRLL